MNGKTILGAMILTACLAFLLLPAFGGQDDLATEVDTLLLLQAADEVDPPRDDEPAAPRISEADSSEQAPERQDLLGIRDKLSRRVRVLRIVVDVLLTLIENGIVGENERAGHAAAWRQGA